MISKTMRNTIDVVVFFSAAATKPNQDAFAPFGFII